MVYSIIYLRRVSHKWKREQREASILTITFKILQLLTYKQIDKLFSDVQKYISKIRVCNFWRNKK